MKTNLILVVRTLVATSIVEYLNSYGSEIEYDFTEPDYFDNREISVFLVTGELEDLQVMKNFIHHTYESSSVMAQFFIKDGKED